MTPELILATNKRAFFGTGHHLPGVMTVPPRSTILSPAEPPANRRGDGSPVFARCGFSVIELLIVIAVLTMASAFVLPSLRGSLDRSRLRAAAVDVQGAWGKARTLAIREGESLSFRCRRGGRQWQIERDRSSVAAGSGQDAAAMPGSFPDSGESSDWEDQNDSGEEHLVRTGQLPEGVTFGRFVIDSLRVAGDAGQDEFVLQATGADSQNASLRSWSRPLTFSADGRSRNAQLELSGADDLTVHVNIRGLTSRVSFTAPFRRLPAERQPEANR